MPAAQKKLYRFCHFFNQKKALIVYDCMNTVHNTTKEKNYWSSRWEAGNTGWDMGSVSPPLKAYADQIANKDLRILIPGAGNAHEAEYLHRQGFTQVTVLDIAPEPLAALQQRVPDFPAAHLVNENFFEHAAEYDLVLEQTFFCSFPPTAENRKAYAKKMSELIVPGGKLVGLWFQTPLDPEGSRPFGGSRAEYAGYFAPYFEVLTFAECYNSIKPRAGKELFGVLARR